jgi:hypothetical protein
MAHKYFSGNLPTNFGVPSFNIEGENGVTIIPATDDAYLLRSPVAGSIRSPNSLFATPRTTIQEGRTGAVAVNRALLGYAAGSRLSDLYGTRAERDFIFSILPIVQNGILQFMQELGAEYVQSCNVRAEFPGFIGEEPVYFRDMENAAAFELRLVLYKE